jgi:MFS transporter, BCD family, chlorophyll transporter
MLDLTAAETAGTFIGAWGLAQAYARGMAKVAGGAVLDIGKHLFGDANLFWAYSVVFALQAGSHVVGYLLPRSNQCPRISHQSEGSHQCCDCQ